MTYEDLCSHFGNANRAASSLNMHRQRVYRWKQGIPRDVQIEIEVLTEGKLKADVPQQIRQSA